VVPELNRATWSDDSNFIEIKSTDPNFKRRAVYHVAVFPDTFDPITELLGEITFHVSYVLTNYEQSNGTKQNFEKISLM